MAGTETATKAEAATEADLMKEMKDIYEYSAALLAIQQKIKPLKPLKDYLASAKGIRELKDVMNQITPAGYFGDDFEALAKSLALISS